MVAAAKIDPLNFFKDIGKIFLNDVKCSTEWLKVLFAKGVKMQTANAFEMLPSKFTFWNT